MRRDTRVLGRLGRLLGTLRGVPGLLGGVPGRLGLAGVRSRRGGGVLRPGRGVGRTGGSGGGPGGGARRDPCRGVGRLRRADRLLRGLGRALGRLSGPTGRAGRLHGVLASRLGLPLGLLGGLLGQLRGGHGAVRRRLGRVRLPLRAGPGFRSLLRQLFDRGSLLVPGAGHLQAHVQELLDVGGGTLQGHLRRLLDRRARRADDLQHPDPVVRRPGGELGLAQERAYVVGRAVQGGLAGFLDVVPTVADGLESLDALVRHQGLLPATLEEVPDRVRGVRGQRLLGRLTHVRAAQGHDLHRPDAVVLGLDERPFMVQEPLDIVIGPHQGGLRGRLDARAAVRPELDDTAPVGVRKRVDGLVTLPVLDRSRRVRRSGPHYPRDECQRQHARAHSAYTAPPLASFSHRTNPSRWSFLAGLRRAQHNDRIFSTDCRDCAAPARRDHEKPAR